LDNIAKQCKTEEEKTWYQQVRTDPKKVKAALKTYHATTIDSGNSKRARGGGWTIATLTESVQASTFVVMMNSGRMLSKVRYVIWAKRGTDMSTAQAEEKWESWKVDPEVQRDNNGDGGALRLRCSLEDEVNVGSSFTAQKTVEMEAKRFKNATVAQVNAMTKAAVSDHGVLMSSGMDTNKAMGALVSGISKEGGGSAPSSAFEGRATAIPNIRDLVPEKEKAPKKKEKGTAGTASDAGSAASESEGSDSDDTPAKATRKTGSGKYWQGDRAVAQAQATVREQARSKFGDCWLLVVRVHWLGF
jgi:hypothetical protein